MEPAHEPDRRGKREVRRGICGPGPVELRAEPRPIGTLVVGAVRDHQGVDPRPEVAADVEHARTLGGAQPLVAIPGPVRGPQRVEVDRQHPGGMGAVHEGIDAAAVQLADEGGHREDDGGRRGDMAHEREAGSRGHGVEIGLDDLRRIMDRERHPDEGQARPVPARGRRQGVERGVVLVVAGEQLVTFPEPQRREHGGDARRGVGDERDPPRVRAEERGDIMAGRIEVPLQLLGEEPDGFLFHPVAPGPLRLEDRGRAGAERPMVEERDVRLEEPRRAIEGASGHGRDASRRRRPTARRPRPMPWVPQRRAGSRAPGRRRARSTLRPAGR